MNNFILFLGKVCSKLEIQEGSTETRPRREGIIPAPVTMCYKMLLQSFPQLAQHIKQLPLNYGLERKLMDTYFPFFN